VDQVGEERDRTRQHEHKGLQRRGRGEDRQAHRDGSDARAGANDGRIYESVGMSMLAVVMVLGPFVRPKGQSSVPMWTVVVMVVGPQAMTMRERAVHRPNDTAGPVGSRAQNPV
jgi:hypothetical protein